MAVFQVVVVGAVVGVIYMLCTAIIAVYSLRSTLSSIDSSTTEEPEYTALEVTFAKRFNSFYFAALDSCGMCSSCGNRGHVD
jgi:hypothetical protein